MRSEPSMPLFLSSYLHVVVESLYVALLFLIFFFYAKKEEKKEKEEEQAVRNNVLIGIKTT
jgi:preprotein translocase subunit YajC